MVGNQSIGLPPTARTFEQWSRAGFKVIKGSKARLRDAHGVPVFTADQVQEYVDPLSAFDGPDLDGFSEEDDFDPGMSRDNL